MYFRRFHALTQFYDRRITQNLRGLNSCPPSCTFSCKETVDNQYTLMLLYLSTRGPTTEYETRQCPVPFYLGTYPLWFVKCIRRQDLCMNNLQYPKPKPNLGSLYHGRSPENHRSGKVHILRSSSKSQRHKSYFTGTVGIPSTHSWPSDPSLMVLNAPSNTYPQPRNRLD